MPSSSFFTQFKNVEVVNQTGQIPGWEWENPQNAISNDNSYTRFVPVPNIQQNSDLTIYTTPYLRFSGLQFTPPQEVLDLTAARVNTTFFFETEYSISSGIGFSVQLGSDKNDPAPFFRILKNGQLIGPRPRTQNRIWFPYSSNSGPPENITYMWNKLRRSWGTVVEPKDNTSLFKVSDLYDPNVVFDFSTALSFLNYDPNIHYFHIYRVLLQISYSDPIPIETTHTFTSFGNVPRDPYDPAQSYTTKWNSDRGNDIGVGSAFRNRYPKLLNWEWKNTTNADNKDGNVSALLPITGSIKEGGLLPSTYTIFNGGPNYTQKDYMPTNFLRLYNITPKITSDLPILGFQFWYARRAYEEYGDLFSDARELRAYEDFIGLYNGSILGSNQAEPPGYLLDRNTGRAWAQWKNCATYPSSCSNSSSSWYGNWIQSSDAIPAPANRTPSFEKANSTTLPYNDFGITLTKNLINDNNFGFLLAPLMGIRRWENFIDAYPQWGVDHAFFKVLYKTTTLNRFIHPMGKRVEYPVTLKISDVYKEGISTGISSLEFVNNLVELKIQKLDRTTTPIPTQENVPVQLLNFKQKIENPILSSLEFIPATHKVGQYYFIDPAISITSQQILTSGHKLDPAAQIRPNSILSQEKFTDLHYLKLAKRIEPQPGVTSQETLPNTHKVAPKIENKPKSIPTSESITNLHSLVRGSNLISISAVFQEFYSQDRDSSYGSLNYSWANPTNAKLKDDAYTELGWDSAGEEPISQPDPLESDYLYALNLDLSSYDIPDDAQIKGIEVSIYRNGRKIDSYFSYDSVVSLTLDDVLIGENKAKAEYWPYDTQGFVEAVYGSLSDTWGVTLTGADIKKSTFGIALSIAFQYGNIDNIGPEPFADPVAPEHLYGVDSINLTFIYQPPIPPSSIGPVSIPTNETFTNQNELIKTELPVLGCITTNFVDHFSIDRVDDNFGSVNYSWFNLEGTTGLNDNSAAYLNWDGIEAQTAPTEDVYSDYIYLQNLLAANVIPDEYEVTGITVKINRKGQSNNSTDWYAYDDTVQLILNDELIGGNQAKTSDIWPKDFEVSQYGGPGDSWGVYLLGSDINDPTFGLAIGIKFNHTNANPYPTGFDFEIDNVEITICYQPVPEDKTIQPLSIETQETTESLDTITKHKLVKTNQDPIFYTRIFSPAYEVGYYDCLAIAKETDISPVNDLTVDSLDTNYLFAANSINLNYAAEVSLSNRLAGEGANPNTFKVNSRQLTLDFTIPIRVESWGYVDSVFSAIYDYFILGHKGNATTFVGRFKYSDVEELSGVSELYIDNIADFTGLVTPFEAYIRTDGGGAAETVIVSEVDKTNKKLNLQSSIVNSYDPYETYIWAKGVLIEEDREPAFSLFSLREGLLSGCMVDRITLNMVPGQTLEANVSIKFTNLDRAYQSILLEQFDDIVSNVNKRKPNYLINAATISLESTSTSGGSFLLGSPKESTFFRGFEELNIRDFEINEISLELNNNLQPVYPLRSSSRSYTERFDQNRNPYAYYSNGRSISGTIKYTSPIKPWLFAEKLSGPSRINKSGLVFNFGSFKLTLPEIVWSPQSSNSAMEQNLQKTVSFNVVTNSLTFDPYLEPTGQP